jgi:hypothetical protein
MPIAVSGAASGPDGESAGPDRDPGSWLRSTGGTRNKRFFPTLEQCRLATSSPQC